MTKSINGFVLWNNITNSIGSMPVAHNLDNSSINAGLIFHTEQEAKRIWFGLGNRNDFIIIPLEFNIDDDEEPNKDTTDTKQV